jgi:hypothetical protein
MMMSSIANLHRIGPSMVTVEVGYKRLHILRKDGEIRYIAGLSERVVAEIMGWEEDQVARIIRRYVSRDAATKAVIRQIDAAKKRT